MKKEVSIAYKEYASVEEMDEKLQRLIAAAQEASANAYAPYSQFQVGAAALLENGTLVTGSNQENAAYPSGLCAERVTLFHANSSFPQSGVEVLAIVAQNKEGFTTEPITPCGACRQVMLETELRYGQDMTVVLYGTRCIRVLKNAKSFLPFFFGGEELK